MTVYIDRNIADADWPKKTDDKKSFVKSTTKKPEKPKPKQPKSNKG